MLAAGWVSHPAVLQEGKEALKEEVEREEGTIEAKGQVVLFRMDELVALEQNRDKRNKDENELCQILTD